MINHQPAFGGLDGDGAGADLGALPAVGGAHHITVLAPVHHIQALAQVDIAEGRVPVITGAAEHHILAVDFAREEHPIAIEGQQGVFKKMEALKVESIADADGGAVVAVAPGDVITVFQPDEARIVAILELRQLRVIVNPLDRFGVDVPVDAVCAAPAMDIHLALFVVAAKNAGEIIFERRHGAVENTVG